MRTNQFTLLENGLHYLGPNGEWLESEDLIEPFFAGAVAQRGPNKAIFSHELNTQNVFDIETPDGTRIRGGIRAIQARNLRSGETVLLARVKESATARLLPPNQIVWTDAFDGIETDVLLIWKHNMFSQEVVLLEQPELPLGWNGEDTRLEVLTEFIVGRQPELRSIPAASEGGRESRNDAVIHFGRMAMIVGKAFSIPDNDAFALGGIIDSGIEVSKEWTQTPDGRNFLVESVAWNAAAPDLANLPKARQARLTPGASLDRPWPATPERRISEAIQVAAVSYRPSGYVVDFVIVPDQGTPTTLSSGQTYYVKTSYYSGSSVTVQAGCTVKFKNNAYMLLYGTVSFPATGIIKAVFTSRNDDLSGEVIAGLQHEPDSDGNPSSHQAAQAIWIYYVSSGTTIKNVDVRWAQRGVQYDMNSGVYVTHNLQSSIFRQSGIGVYASLGNATLALSNLKKCNVTTGITCSGYCTGSITELSCSTPSYTPNYWNDNGSIQECNNCYNYANNKRTDTFAQPGYASGSYCQSLSCITVEQISQYAKNDGLIPTTRDATVPCGMTKVALAIYPEHDFHWYRQDANGLWSHKQDVKPATNFDASTNLISNPETANRYPYTNFGGYFLTCSSSTEGQGNATIAGNKQCLIGFSESDGEENAHVLVINVFSGRPNPVVSLTDKDMIQIAALINKAMKVPDRDPQTLFPPYRLGYSGLSLKTSSRIGEYRTAQSVTRIIGSDIQVLNGDDQYWLKANDSNLENFLLDLALQRNAISAALYDDIGQMIKAMENRP